MSAQDVEDLRRELAAMQTSIALCCEQIKNLRVLVILVGVLSAGGSQAAGALVKALGV